MITMNAETRAVPKNLQLSVLVSWAHVHRSALPCGVEGRRSRVPRPVSTQLWRALVMLLDLSTGRVLISTRRMLFKMGGFGVFSPVIDGSR